jgi:hypothetical protein
VSVQHPGNDDERGNACAGPDQPRCSAKGCREPAVEDLRWRNPRLHDSGRVKHWLACPEHAEKLADFLSARDFLIDRAAL